MKEVFLLIIGLAVHTQSFHALISNPLLTGKGYIHKPGHLLTEHDVKDYLAAGFRGKGDTVQWFEISVKCPKDTMWCAQFHYLRKKNDSSERLLEYTPLHCTYEDTLSHSAMVILNEPGEGDVEYEPHWILVHDCVDGASKYSQREGQFHRTNPGRQNHRSFQVQLDFTTPVSSDRSQFYSYSAPWRENTGNAHYVWNGKNQQFDYEYLSTIQWPMEKPTVYSVLHPYGQSSELERCRAVENFNTIYCTRDEYLHYKSRSFSEHTFTRPR